MYPWLVAAPQHTAVVVDVEDVDEAEGGVSGVADLHGEGPGVFALRHAKFDVGFDMWEAVGGVVIDELALC